MMYWTLGRRCQEKPKTFLVTVSKGVMAVFVSRFHHISYYIIIDKSVSVLFHLDHSISLLPKCLPSDLLAIIASSILPTGII